MVHCEDEKPRMGLVRIGQDWIGLHWVELGGVGPSTSAQVTARSRGLKSRALPATVSGTQVGRVRKRKQQETVEIGGLGSGAGATAVH